MKPASPGTRGSHKFIQVRGARQHNLQNIDVDIPRDRMTVVTGLSGSGKSSLAFDTIFAEGQRKYVESLSIHARQFLDQMPKPDVERISGLTPTIAIEQRSAASNPRSTVATTTEVYDFLRVLFARTGIPACWRCGREISRQSTAQIVDQILSLPLGVRFMVLAPQGPAACEAGNDVLSTIARQGFVRARIDGKIVHLEDVVGAAKSGKKESIDVVVDRLSVKEHIGARVADSVELALSMADGRVIIAIEGEDGRIEDRMFSSRFACAYHLDVHLAELSPRLFSFNSPHGACPACHGLGTVLEFDPDLLVSDPKMSLAAGVISGLGPGGRRGASTAALVTEFCEKFQVSPEIPYRNIPERLASILMHGTSKADVQEHGVAFEGVVNYLRKRWETTDSESVKQKLHAYLSEAPCEACGGARLRPEALSVRIIGKNIAELCGLNVAAARAFFDNLEYTGERAIVAAPILRELRARLSFMCDVGIEYLSLDRSASTLSGGEAQRIRLATQIGSGLVGVCYVLDEPTIGLHQRDSRRLVATLKRLTRTGNTVLVVEHDETTIAAADHIIDMGPGAGAHGGRVVAQGTLSEVLESEESISAKYLTGRNRIEVPATRRPIDEGRAIKVYQATANNLRNIDVAFPLGCFICVTGVSGSGKSTLVEDILLRTLKRVINGSGPRPGAYKRLSGASMINRVIAIDQSPIGRTPRSNPATYVGVFDLIRQLYAKTRESKIRGYSPARFSFNVKGGRCEDCQGQGTRRIELHFLPDVFVDCATCKATRYSRETLEIRYRGKSVADVLAMRVEDAVRFFGNFPKIKQLLRALLEVGLGYVTLGQSSITLSGGEAQRVKLAAELGKTAADHTLYVLDEPTTGLHLADIHNLVNVLNRLVDLGHTMVVIEHNLDVIKMADWVIDLGPGGGDAGGRVVAVGTPEQVAACDDSFTGVFLRDRLAGKPIIELRAGRRRRRA